nr:MAG TPA: hypothetical protein [Caudoviricetes sp.]
MISVVTVVQFFTQFINFYIKTLFPKKLFSSKKL